MSDHLSDNRIMRLDFIVFFVSTGLSALLALLAFYKFSQRDKLVKLVGLLAAFSALCNSASYLFYISKKGSLMNLPGTFYDFATVIIAGIFFNHFTKGKFRRAIVVITLTFVVLDLINVAFIQQAGISSYGKVFMSIILIGYSLMAFYQLLIDMPAHHINQMPIFWFCSAFLIYHSGATFLFAFKPYLPLLKLEGDEWFLHNYLVIVNTVLMTVGVAYEYSQLRKPKTIAQARR